MLLELKNYIKKAKSKLSKGKAHNCENWGQNELQKAKSLLDYEHYNESVSLINDFEKWIETKGE